MTSRAEFLGRVRAGLSTAAPANLAHPQQAVVGVPEVEYADPLDDVLDAFVLAAEATGARVRRLSSAPDLVTLLSEVVDHAGGGPALLSADPELDRLPPLLEGMGVGVVEPADREAASTCRLGIAGGVWAIAATGTVVVDADRAGSRTAALLPATALLLVEADRILATAGDLFRRNLGALPSQRVLISGPSRSGDIEFVLTTGVHGPGSLFIGILEAPTSS